MYEALVARVRYHIQKANFMGLKEAESTLLLAEAANAIEELQAQLMYSNDMAKAIAEKVPRWIPVTERLPESICKPYLCLTDTGYCLEVRWTNNVYGLWKSDNKWGWSIFDVPQYCKVTYWMPLPEPPK